MKEGGVFNLHKVFNVEIFLSLLNTVLCKCGCFRLFVNYIVAVVSGLSILLFIHLCNLDHFKSLGKCICLTVKVS